MKQKINNSEIMKNASLIKYRYLIKLSIDILKIPNKIYYKSINPNSEVIAG